MVDFCKLCHTCGNAHLHYCGYYDGRDIPRLLVTLSFDSKIGLYTWQCASVLSFVNQVFDDRISVGLLTHSVSIAKFEWYFC